MRPSEGGGVAVLEEQCFGCLSRLRRGLFVVAVRATRALMASSLKGAERATTGYYKGRAWDEARLSDADVVISRVSIMRLGNVLCDGMITRCGYGTWYSCYGSCVR